MSVTVVSRRLRPLLNVHHPPSPLCFVSLCALENDECVDNVPPWVAYHEKVSPSVSTKTRLAPYNTPPKLCGIVFGTLWKRPVNYIYAIVYTSLEKLDVSIPSQICVGTPFSGDPIALMLFPKFLPPSCA